MNVVACGEKSSFLYTSDERKVLGGVRDLSSRSRLVVFVVKESRKWDSYLNDGLT